MGKKRIEMQFEYAMRGVFLEGADKHALKKDNKLTDTPYVFSFSYKDSLLAFSDNLSRSLQKKCGKIKLVKEITPQMINDFLLDKSFTCSKATMDAYVSHVKKWELILNDVYNARIKWADNLVVPSRISKDNIKLKRVQQMEPNHFEAIMKYAEKRRSAATPAFEISRRFGARVEGTVTVRAQDVHLDTSGRWGLGQVRLKEKGARERFVDIRTQADRDFIAAAITEKEPNEQLVCLKKDSVNKQLNRIMTKLGLKAQYKDTGMHSIRKLWAQETWDMCRTSGMEFKETIRYLNNQLGHGKDRDKKLLGVYVKNMH